MPTPRSPAACCQGEEIVFFVLFPPSEGERKGERKKKTHASPLKITDPLQNNRKYIKPGGAPSTSRLNLFEGYMDRYNKSLAREAVGKYCEVAEKHGLSPTQLALGW